MINTYLQYLRKTLGRQQEKHHTLFVVIIVLLLVGVSYALLYPSLHTMLHNNLGNSYFNKGNSESARSEYLKAGQSSTTLSTIPKSNLGALAYQADLYDEAFRIFSDTFATACAHNATSTQLESTNIKQSDICATLAYDLGNTLYRLGEESVKTASTSTSTSTHKTRDDLWMKAISAYQQSLVMNSEDTEAQENIDFILQQLNASSTNETATDSTEEDNTASDQTQDDTENSSTDSENTANGDQDNNASDKQDDATGDGETTNDSGDSSDEKETSADTNQTDGTSDKSSNNANPDSLSDAEKKQVEAYMKQLDQQSRAQQQLFNQNPNSNNQAQNQNDPFNDPFFSDFFKGTPFETQFSGGQKSLDKNW